MAWEFPNKENNELLSNGFPNYCAFELHNAAYPAKMAFETSRHLNDSNWTNEVAWPIVMESTRFFYAILSQEKDGKWSIDIKPSMGQDENGGENCKNYLCSLYSAQYCLQTALKLAEELDIQGIEIDNWKTILKDGLAFNRLYNENNEFYDSCEGLSKESFGNEKHPVQLNPLTFTPFLTADKYVKKAYEKRRDICSMTKLNHYPGWTLGAFWLASSHMESAGDLSYELSQIVTAEYTDKEWISFFEHSSSYCQPYYITTHGLYVQAITDAIISDFWGETRFGKACPINWNHVEFYNLHTLDGKSWSGEKSLGNWKISEVL